jgi:hypothetical protein
MESGAVRHNFERDHPCQVWFNLVQRFQRRRFKCDLLSKYAHSRWLLLLKIEISSIVHCCFIINQAELKFNCSYMAMSSLTYIPGFSVKFSFYRLCSHGLKARRAKNGIYVKLPIAM